MNERISFDKDTTGSYNRHIEKFKRCKINSLNIELNNNFYSCVAGGVWGKTFRFSKKTKTALPKFWLATPPNMYNEAFYESQYNKNGRLKSFFYFEEFRYPSSYNVVIQ